MSERYFRPNEMLVVGAFRYYLGRKTYAACECAEWLIANWQTLNDVCREIVLRETAEALRCGKAGMDTDRKCWQRVVALGEPVHAVEAVLQKAVPYKPQV